MASCGLHEAWASGIFEWSPQRVGGVRGMPGCGVRSGTVRRQGYDSPLGQSRKGGLGLGFLFKQRAPGALQPVLCMLSQGTAS